MKLVKFVCGAPKKNIDISKSYIDKLLSEKMIIVNLILSGGVPTLNEELIECTIDKIIYEHLFVLSLQWYKQQLKMK